MKHFFKYHGAGNDFILLDNRDGILHFGQDEIAKLCNRRLGIGADGMILIQNKRGFDFEMVYFNSDGGLGSMCGNGGRCAVIFAGKLGIVKSKARFLAFDGLHEAVVTGENKVKLSMSPVNEVEISDGDYVLDTGSPHYVKFIPDVSKIDVIAEGRAIRYNSRFSKEGINVNFASYQPENILMRTYERGVEDETLSCGTGTVAVAISAALRSDKLKERDSLTIQSLGGSLTVYFTKKEESGFENVWLEGPVAFIYEGFFAT